LDKIFHIIKKNDATNLHITDETFVNNTLDYHVELEENAVCVITVALINISSVVCNIYVHLKGDQSQAIIKGLYALDGLQQVKINTYQYHQGKDSKSELIIKGMLKDKAHANYQGMIKIDLGATGTDASQTNKNIVLSSDAKVVSVPSIEVLQHDVQCCHGSAIGKFDTQELWYLQSKGLQPKRAQELLVRSFFQDVLNEQVNQEAVLDMLCQKMV
tara:strand:- start:49 stop:696 length:648 start_codon:yes stop_codon:yes gene_type:complete